MITEISQRDQVLKYLYLSSSAVEINPETYVCFKRIPQAAERGSTYKDNAMVANEKQIPKEYSIKGTSKTNPDEGN